MKLHLEIYFKTDGDFCFLGINNLKQQVDDSNSIYSNVIQNCEVHDDNAKDETYYIILDCEGSPNPCRWAARDLIQHLLTDGISLVHYWVLGDIYKLLSTALEKVLWTEEDIDYVDSSTLSGNYFGSYLRLYIEH